MYVVCMQFKAFAKNDELLMYCKQLLQVLWLLLQARFALQA